jgi:hypothetical protein
MRTKSILRVVHISATILVTTAAVCTLVSIPLLFGKDAAFWTMTYNYVESDCSINDCREGSANVAIDFSWLKTLGDGSLESTSRNESQYHQGENPMQHQPRDPMIGGWGWYEPFVGEIIDGPCILALGTECVFA